MPVSAATQIPAHAASCTPVQKGSQWWIPYGCSGVIIPASHRCYQLGSTTDSAGTTDADECADISAANDGGSTGYAQLWGEGEFYCQGVYSQCQGMNVNIDFSYTVDNSIGGAWTAPERNYTCNPNPGPACPDGGRALISTEHATVLTTQCDTTYSWDPYDGWNGLAQVISVTPAGVAEHAAYENDSYQLDVCFDQP